MLGPAGADGAVLVVGDANANSVAPAVVAAAESMGLRTLQWSRVGCPLLLGRAPVHYERCAEWQDEVIRLVERVRPVAVVVANQATAYTASTDDPTVLAAPDGGRPPSAASAVRDWGQALDRLLSDLDRRGIPTVVVGPIPDFGPGFPRTRFSLVVPDPAVPHLDRSAIERERAAVVAVEQGVVAGHAAARWLDPLPRLCPATCTPLRDGRWTYLERASLTNAASELLAGDLEQHLRELVRG